MLEKKLKQIPKKELIDKKYYLGRGRNGNIGLWDSKCDCFLVIGYSFGESRIKSEGYYEKIRGKPKLGKNYGCFQPFMLIDEGEMIEASPREFEIIRLAKAVNKNSKHGYGKTLLVKFE